MSDAIEKAKKIIQGERDLVRRVFATEDGQRLLALLAERHVRAPIADFGCNEKTWWRLGQAELIIDFINITENKHE